MYAPSPFREQRKSKYYDEVIRLRQEENLRICEIAHKLSLKQCTVSFWLRTYSYGFSKRWIKQLLPGGYLPSELRGALWSGSPRSAEDNRRNCLFQLAG